MRKQKRNACRDLSKFGKKLQATGIAVKQLASSIKNIALLTSNFYSKAILIAYEKRIVIDELTVELSKIIGVVEAEIYRRKFWQEARAQMVMPNSDYVLLLLKRQINLTKEAKK